MLIPKAEWILLNNPRDEVGGIFQQYSLSLRKMIVVIIKHCAYFVLIAVITRVKMCEELVYFIQSATETWYLSLESVPTNSVAVALRNYVFFLRVYHFLWNIDKHEATSLKLAPLPLARGDSCKIWRNPLSAAPLAALTLLCALRLKIK